MSPSFPKKFQRRLRSALLLVTLALLAGGCGTQQHKSSNWSKTAKVRQETDGTRFNDPWFCQAALTDNAWDCMQNTALATRPRPERLPEPAPPEPPPSVPEEDPQNVTKHVALSYKPSRPIAIIDLPADYYAVQLMALSSKASLEQYAHDNKLSGLSAARVWNGDQILFVLLLGIYENLTNAELAVESLCGALGKLNPWIRSVGSLQAAMLAADSVTGNDPF